MKNSKCEPFDPFGDFEINGYLQNIGKDKNQRVIKEIENNVFELKLSEALHYLSTRKTITYNDFLATHKIIFTEYYPSAGQDRTITAPNCAIGKANIYFAAPNDSKLAIEYGLKLSQTKMKSHVGEIMGLFAYGHPFLDGNGRTILLVHMELCYRAGFSIAWEMTTKQDYLSALTKEIYSPSNGVLDNYLSQFITQPVPRNEWKNRVLSIQGLDGLAGLDEENEVYGKISDPKIEEEYKNFTLNRSYQLDQQAHSLNNKKTNFKKM